MSEASYRLSSCEHYTPARQNSTKTTVRYFIGHCPFCEIERIKLELESVRTDKARIANQRDRLEKERNSWQELVLSNANEIKHLRNILNAERFGLEGYHETEIS